MMLRLNSAPANTCREITMRLDNAPNLDQMGGEPKKPGTPTWAIVVTFGIVVLIGSCFVKGGGSNSSPLGSASEARVECSSSIEQRLRDPSSVEWIDRFSWPATRADNGVWTVHARYRARNGFGGMNLEDHECRLWKASDRWSVLR
jgi:hypothetical protein